MVDDLSSLSQKKKRFPVVCAQLRDHGIARVLESRHGYKLIEVMKEHLCFCENVQFLCQVGRCQDGVQQRT